KGTTMPMIDVYAPSDLLPSGSDRRIGEELTRAVLRAEGVPAPGPFHLENTAAYIHRMEPATVQTAADAVARVIRVQIITPPGALLRSGQKQVGAAHRSNGRRLGHRRHCVRPRGICRFGGRGRKEVRVR